MKLAIHVAKWEDNFVQQLCDLLLPWISFLKQALDFIHEIGWLLRRSKLKFRLGLQDPNLDTFPFQRFRWLIEFSVEHDWCAVVKMLLNVLVNKLMGEEKRSSIEDALLENGLLHRAVRRNCRSMVEVLLRYHLDADLKKLSPICYVFRPMSKALGAWLLCT